MGYMGQSWSEMVYVEKRDMTNSKYFDLNGPFKNELEILLTTDGKGKQAKLEALEKLLDKIYGQGQSDGYQEGFWSCHWNS